MQVKSSTPTTYQTQADLDAALARWQKILRLEDWDVKASLCPNKDMDGAQANVRIHRLHKLATITIRIAGDDPGSRDEAWPHDHEHSLVHELLHIAVNAFEPDRECELKTDLFEQFIDSHSRVLTTLARSSSQA